jgi:hypothetical protein
MKEAASEARKQIASATSPGSPNLPIGIEEGQMIEPPSGPIASIANLQVRNIPRPSIAGDERVDDAEALERGGDDSAGIVLDGYAGDDGHDLDLLTQGLGSLLQAGLVDVGENRSRALGLGSFQVPR